MVQSDPNAIAADEQAITMLTLQSLVLEKMGEGVSVCDENGFIVLSNPAFDKMFGYNPGELKGEHITVLNDCSDEEKGRIFSEIMGKLRSVGECSGEFSNRRKDGSQFVTFARISAARAAGKQYWVTVQEDISRRMNSSAEIDLLHENLAAHAAELEALNRELEAFSYTVSHDLRKPLTRIMGYTEVVLEQCSEMNYRPCKDYLQEISAGAERMNKLIDTMLELSMLAKKEVKRERVSLSDLATAVALELKLTEPGRKVNFHIAEGVVVNGDPDLLRVALENLLGNAWKYSVQKDDALIIFGVTESNDTPAYFVCDNGVGFDMAQSEKIFTPFQRLPNAKSYQGFGIGLATVKRIINGHGGRIWAEGNIGTGATFYFTLE
ncbi:ATP-binding protein [Geotalea sp. SG265]|uniref:PAS domain-containing sensor histidine kinase n=1 Tax=Geotalea sp. SG265 TaxID=2922867 RepID=UPI001FAEFE3D|nr:ATP-binding protein [Geotalea sp. SG265]